MPGRLASRHLGAGFQKRAQRLDVGGGIEPAATGADLGGGAPALEPILRGARKPIEPF